MDLPELYFKIIYKIVKKQNEMLLKEISLRENISLIELKQKYLPSMKSLKNFYSPKL